MCALRLTEVEYRLLQERLNKGSSPEAKPSKTRIGYRSKAESDFATTGSVYFEQTYNLKLEVLLYEPFKLSIPGGIYTPDFFFKEKQVARFGFIEIKGSRHQKNYRDARSKLRAAAEVYWYFEFYEARKVGGKWMFERI